MPAATRLLGGRARLRTQTLGRESGAFCPWLWIEAEDAESVWTLVCLPGPGSMAALLPLNPEAPRVLSLNQRVKPSF